MKLSICIAFASDRGIKRRVWLSGAYKNIGNSQMFQFI